MLLKIENYETNKKRNHRKLSRNWSWVFIFIFKMDKKIHVAKWKYKSIKSQCTSLLNQYIENWTINLYSMASHTDDVIEQLAMTNYSDEDIEKLLWRKATFADAILMRMYFLINDQIWEDEDDEETDLYIRNMGMGDSSILWWVL